MMSSIFYEEIKENRLNTWKENKNPYDILADNNRIERLGGWIFCLLQMNCLRIVYRLTGEVLLINVRKSSL